MTLTLDSKLSIVYLYNPNKAKPVRAFIGQIYLANLHTDTHCFSPGSILYAIILYASVELCELIYHTQLVKHIPPDKVQITGLLQFSRNVNIKKPMWVGNNLQASDT